MQWQSPYLIRPGHCHIEESLVQRQSKPIRRDTIAHQLVQSAIDTKSIDPARLIRHTGLSLISKEDIALTVDNHVVDTLEALQIVSRKERRDLI